MGYPVLDRRPVAGHARHRHVRLDDGGRPAVAQGRSAPADLHRPVAVDMVAVRDGRLSRRKRRRAHLNVDQRRPGLRPGLRLRAAEHARLRNAAVRAAAPTGTALWTLIRNIGSSVGISIVIAQLTSRTTLFHSQLMEQRHALQPGPSGREAARSLHGIGPQHAGPAWSRGRRPSWPMPTTSADDVDQPCGFPAAAAHQGSEKGQTLGVGGQTWRLRLCLAFSLRRKRRTTPSRRAGRRQRGRAGRPYFTSSASSNVMSTGLSPRFNNPFSTLPV